jgi:hypothetical protein
MPTAFAATSSIPEPGTAFSQLQTNYGPQAQTLGRSASDAYFAHLGLLQFISVVLTIFFTAATIYVAVKTGWLGTRVDRIRDVVFKSELSKKRAEETWDEIEEYFFVGDDNDLRMALMRADALLDDALRNAGIRGEQLGDRLKNIKPTQLPNLEDVWQAHKLRNRIAHEPDFVVKRDLAERALAVYEKALEHLGVLGPEEVPGPKGPKAKSR